MKLEVTYKLEILFETQTRSETEDSPFSKRELSIGSEVNGQRQFEC